MPAVKDASGLYEVERRQYHAERPGFRIAELQISPTQQVPWHYHSNVHDTFYVISGTLRIFLRDPRNRSSSNRGRPMRCRPAARISSPTPATARRSSLCCRESATTTSSR